jgi:hypothetical protein
VGVYIFRDANSDLATPASGRFYKKLLTTTAAQVNVSSGSIAALATVDAHMFTDPGDPGVLGSGGSFNPVEINIVTGSSTVTVTCLLVHIDSTGGAKNSTSFATTQPATTGVKIFTFSTAAWTFVAGDRFRVQVRFVNTSSMTAATISLGANTTNAEVTVPWTPPAPPAGGLAPVLLRDRRLTSALIQM